MIWTKVLPVAGFMLANCSPDAASQKLPSTKAWVRNVTGCCSRVVVIGTPPILPEARLCGHRPRPIPVAVAP